MHSPKPEQHPRNRHPLLPRISAMAAEQPAHPSNRDDFGAGGQNHAAVYFDRWANDQRSDRRAEKRLSHQGSVCGVHDRRGSHYSSSTRRGRTGVTCSAFKDETCHTASTREVLAISVFPNDDEMRSRCSLSPPSSAEPFPRRGGRRRERGRESERWLRYSAPKERKGRLRGRL